MIKLLLYKVLPAGAAAALLFSNASPLQSTLRTFESAGNALGGDEAVNTSDLGFPDEASVNSAIGGGWADRAGGGGKSGFSLGKMIDSLFGSSNSKRTQAQLASIIASVKAKAPAGGAAASPKAAGKGAPAGKGTGKNAPASSKAPGKGAPARDAPTPTPTPSPRAEPAPAGAPQ
jgi:hypothetical protein